MAKTIGVGGVFLGLHGNDQELRDWYQEHLNMPMSPYGTGFIDGQQLMLVSFTRSGETDQPMINFRVDDLRELIDHLRQINCEILSDVTAYPYGLFAQFRDPFDNVIELWQADDEAYRQMVLEEIAKYQKKSSFD